MAGEEFAARLMITRALRDIQRQMGEGINSRLAAFLRGMDVGAKGDLEKRNRAIAAKMRTEVRAAYEADVENQKVRYSHRRANRLSGHLGRVVRRSDLVRGNSEGIEYVKASVWDKEAAHWRRLNFGAGAQAGAQPGPVPIRLFGETLFSAQLEGGPSPAFALPPGFFFRGGRPVMPDPNMRGAGTTQPFAPNRKSPYQGAVTEGIRGRHFLEVGLEVLQRELPIEYGDLMNDWIQRGGRKAKAVLG